MNNLDKWFHIFKKYGFKDLFFAVVYICIAEFIQWLQCSSGFLIGQDSSDTLVGIASGSSSINSILGLGGGRCFNMALSGMPYAHGILGIFLYLCMFAFLFLLVRGLWRLVFRGIFRMTFN